MLTSSICCSSGSSVLLSKFFSLRALSFGRYGVRTKGRCSAQRMVACKRFNIRFRTWWTFEGSYEGVCGSGWAPSLVRYMSAHSEPLFNTLYKISRKLGTDGVLLTSGNLTSNSATRASVKSPNVIFSQTKWGKSFSAFEFDWMKMSLLCEVER